jgi:phage baseplate assembly protein W
MDTLVDGPAPLSIGAKGMDALVQNIRIIVLTTMYSVPLDRGFAHAGTALDSPAPLVTARLTAEITEAIEEKEPRVKVDRIHFEPVAGVSGHMEGRYAPRVVFHVREGAGGGIL